MNGSSDLHQRGAITAAKYRRATSEVPLAFAAADLPERLGQDCGVPRSDTQLSTIQPVGRVQPGAESNQAGGQGCV